MKHISRAQVIRKILYTIGALGALTSLLFWLPSTLMVLERQGFLIALQSTLLPRVMLDALLIGLCIDGVLR